MITLSVRSTRVSTVARESQRWPVEHLPTQALDPIRLWVFTDGGTLGWHAAVLVEPSTRARHVAACRANAARNVGSELDGVILGLQLAPTSARLSLVSDFLWSAYYINGWRKISHPYLRDRVAVARDLLTTKKFSSPVFIHHGGHDGAQTDFSLWNAAADQLCKQRATVDASWDFR